MSDRLAALRRQLHEMECRIADGAVDDEFAAHMDATELEARIATLELADGNALSFPVTGAAA
jgi:hypothetical protein